jgi:hypothetical protein
MSIVPRTVKSILAARRLNKHLAEERAYEAMIATSQAHLAETKLVPGYTNVYA